MDNKKDLSEMIESLSPEELASLSKLLSQVSSKSNKKKRGRGNRKRKNKAPPPSYQPDFMDDIQLSAEERREIDEAAKFDKKKGLDKPKKDATMPKSPQFQKISIKCMSCGKTFDISPALIPPERDRFKCNSCSCSAG
tara:strand:+ start:87 stop:500 length:414 start_codon:yes stop_codon:yes gene_type:complete